MKNFKLYWHGKFFILTILFFTYFHNISSAQLTKEVLFWYISYDSSAESSNLDGLNLRGGNDFKTKRKYINRYQFVEFGLYNSDTTDGYEFKEANKKWYIFQAGKWKIFFDPLSPHKKRSFSIAGDSYYLKYKGIWYLKKNKTYLLKLEPIGFKTTVNVTYFFNIEKGIIGVRTNDIIYLRDPL